jgi:DNA-binding beta-propeller fold protein YncE
MQSMGAPLLLAALLLAGCSAPIGGVPRRTPATVLYVANGGDGTITRLNGASGCALGPPLPAGRSPGQVVSGANGSLLVAALGNAFEGTVTHLLPRGGPFESTYRMEALVVEPGTALVHLAGDGERFAVLLYRRVGQPMGPTGCRLAMIDTATGYVDRTGVPCSQREVAVGLAVGRDAAGVTAYISTWSSAGEVDGHWRPGEGRIRAVDALSGALLASHRSTGMPEQLLLSPAPGGSRRLYVVESIRAAGVALESGSGPDVAAANRVQLVGLNLATLDPESALPLDHLPRAMAISPDGNHAYTVAGLTTPRQLMHVNLATGDSRLLATVPGSGHGGLAVVGNRIYVPNPAGREVAVFDRRSGRPLGTAPTGRHPVDIIAAPASAG